MAIEVRFTHDDAGTVWVGSGSISGTDMLQANEQVYQRGELFKKLRFCLMDFSKTVSIDFTREEMRIIVNQDKAAATLNPNIAFALVASEDVMYGIFRMYEAYVDEFTWDTMTTRSLSEATDWIKKKTGLTVYRAV